jgi:hypothetical protein
LLVDFRLNAGSKRIELRQQNLYEYARNNPLRNIDRDGFKLIPAVFARAEAKMNAISQAGGGTFGLFFQGIEIFPHNPSQGTSNWW